MDVMALPLTKTHCPPRFRPPLSLHWVTFFCTVAIFCSLVEIVSRGGGGKGFSSQMPMFFVVYSITCATALVRKKVFKTLEKMTPEYRGLLRGFRKVERTGLK